MRSKVITDGDAKYSSHLSDGTITELAKKHGKKVYTFCHKTAEIECAINQRLESPERPEDENLKLLIKAEELSVNFNSTINGFYTTMLLLATNMTNLELGGGGDGIPDVIKEEAKKLFTRIVGEIPIIGHLFQTGKYLNDIRESRKTLKKAKTIVEQMGDSDMRIIFVDRFSTKVVESLSYLAPEQLLELEIDELNSELKDALFDSLLSFPYEDVVSQARSEDRRQTDKVYYVECLVNHCLTHFIPALSSQIDVDLTQLAYIEEEIPDVAFDSDLSADPEDEGYFVSLSRSRSSGSLDRF